MVDILFLPRVQLFLQTFQPLNRDQGLLSLQRLDTFQLYNCIWSQSSRHFHIYLQFDNISINQTLWFYSGLMLFSCLSFWNFEKSLPIKAKANLSAPSQYPAAMQHTPHSRKENTKVGFRPQWSINQMATREGSSTRPNNMTDR